METQSIKSSKSSGNAKVDTCAWRESGDKDVYFLNIIRIFLEVGNGYVDQIGTMDFVGIGLEMFKQTMERANKWIAQQPPDMNICNVQSIEYKVKGGWYGGEVDTKKSCYCVHRSLNTSCRCIVRVYWTQGSDGRAIPRQQPLKVTYRTFIPCKITRRQYETQIDSSKRMLAWINATGAKVMCCETIKVRVLDEDQNGNPEVTFVTEVGSRVITKHYILGLRLYLDGDYVDPPPRVLPPVPQIQNDDDCCTIL